MPWPLFLIAGSLAAFDGFLRLTFAGRQHRAQPPFAWFSATDEGSVPTWFAVLTMAATGICCLRQRTAPRGTWRLMGLLFCYLAVDDLFGVHEAVGEAVHPWLAGHGVYTWVLTLGACFAGLGGWCALRLSKALWPERRRWWCMVAGFAALALALALEAGEGAATRSAWRPRGIALVDWAQWLEEALELLGPCLLLAAAWPRPAAGDGPAALSPG